MISMAIYHLSGKVISRSQGRSSVAASAYRAAEKLYDERTGISHNFTKKEVDIIHKEILAPDNAPKHLTEREQLWNAVEAKENRKDAQLAREFTIALPRELTEKQNIELARTFVQKEFVDNGMIADLCLHRGHKSSEDQPHIHVMLTMRNVTEEGFGLKNRDWNSKELLQVWREAWSEHCNQALAQNGHDMQIDHRTLEAQGIDLEPQTKIGPKDAGARMVRFEEHRQIARENGERLIENPEILLSALTRQQSTFTHRDIARVVHRYTDGAEQFNQVYSLVKTHATLEYLGLDDSNAQRFTTTEMLSLETKMLAQTENMGAIREHKIEQKQMDKAGKNQKLTAEQQVALEHITSGRDLACVAGFAGTGKSYMLRVAKDAWEAQGYNVKGMALSGIAAEGLEAGSGISSRTVASHIWYWDRNLESLGKKDVVVLDEAGMLGSRQMARVVDMASSSGAKLVLIGDTEQLQAIEAGAAFRAISDKAGVATMTEVQRQREPWQQQATKDFANGKTRDALDAYREHDNMHVFNTKAEAISNMLEQWHEVSSNNPATSQLMLAFTRADVAMLNTKARQARIDNAELGQDCEFKTAKGLKNFAVNEKIYFLQNDRHLGVKNGTLGVIEKINGNSISVQVADGTDKSRQVTFNIKDYNNIDYGYAATIHKAQGITVDRTHLLASTYLDKHSSYVGMSRHRSGADLYVSREEFPTMEALSQALGRENHKDVSLDYALNRGFEVNQDNYGNDMQMQSAEDRINQRLQEKAIQVQAVHEQELKVQKNIEVDAAIHKIMSEKNVWLQRDFVAGDRGIYSGTITLAGERFGLLRQQQENIYKVLPENCMESQHKGERMEIIERFNVGKVENELKAIQPEKMQQLQQEKAMQQQLQLQRSLERSLDRGFER